MLFRHENNAHQIIHINDITKGMSSLMPLSLRTMASWSLIIFDAASYTGKQATNDFQH